MRYRSPSIVRNFIFGVEDSLVSTVGLLSGVAITGASRDYLVLTGTVLIFVEAFSMAMGSILSEHSAEEYEKKGEVSVRIPIKGGLVMFFSYFISGFIPLLPYVAFPSGNPFLLSVAFSLVTLGLLGVFSGRISGTRIAGNIFNMVVLGGIAIGVGIAVGSFVSGFNIQ